MRAIVLVGLSIVLSGCSGGNSLATYILQPVDAPACSLMPMSDPDLQQAREDEQVRLTGNPGRVQNAAFRQGNTTPVDNMVSVYDCTEEDGAFAQALQFASPAEADTWLAQSDYCTYGIGSLLRDGTIVAWVFGPDDVIGSWQGRVTNQTGAQAAC